MSLRPKCKRLPHSFRVAALALAVVGAGASCAAKMGKEASAGAIEGWRATSSNDPEQQVFRVGARRALEGGLEALDDPAEDGHP